MTKKEFIEFIKELGFINTWQSIDDKYHMETDIVDQLKIIIIDGIVQLSLSQMSSHITAGKNFGNFSLKTFGDKNDLQLMLFMSFVKGSFKKVPDKIIQYIRDKKIKDILK